jgi:hypothetical protein
LISSKIFGEASGLNGLVVSSWFIFKSLNRGGGQVGVSPDPQGP